MELKKIQVQKIKALASMPDDLSFILRIHMGEKEGADFSRMSSDCDMCTHVLVHTK